MPVIEVLGQRAVQKVEALLRAHLHTAAADISRKAPPDPVHLAGDERELRRAHRGPRKEIGQRSATVRNAIAHARQVSLRADIAAISVQDDLDDLRRIGTQRVRTTCFIGKIGSPRLEDAVLCQGLLPALQSWQRKLLLPLTNDGAVNSTSRTSAGIRIHIETRAARQSRARLRLSLAAALLPCHFKFISRLPALLGLCRGCQPAQIEAELRHPRIAAEIHVGPVFIARLMVALRGELLHLLLAPGRIMSGEQRPLPDGKCRNAIARKGEVSDR